MKKTSQPITHIIIFSMVLGLALFLFYLTQIQLMAVGRAQVRVNDLTENQAKLTGLVTLLPIYSELSRLWLKTLPANEKEVAAFASQIEGLAKVQNLTIALSFDDFPGPIDVSGHYIAGLGAEVSLNGSYAGVSNFLTNLASLPYFFKIDKITLTKPETNVGVKAIINGALMMNLKI